MIGKRGISQWVMVMILAAVGIFFFLMTLKVFDGFIPK
jgi:hypothetical protein